MFRLQKSDKILIVVAHPDDELLGLGASMHKFIYELNIKVRVVILGEGITSRYHKKSSDQLKKELEIHKNNIYDAGNHIGYKNIYSYNFPDNRFDTTPILDLIKLIEEHKNDFNPNIIFTHHGGDLNVDHQITFQAVMTAFRPINGNYKETILTFETPSGTEWTASTEPNKFIPNIFIEISSKNLDAKIKGIESYKYEKRKYPHPRSPESLKILAMYRGLTVGYEYAECFQLIRSKI